MSTSSFELEPELPPQLNECLIRSSAVGLTSKKLRSLVAFESELGTCMGLGIRIWTGEAMVIILFAYSPSSTSSSSSSSSLTAPRSMSQLLDELHELKSLEQVLSPSASSLSLLRSAVVPSIKSLTSIDNELLHRGARSWIRRGGSLGCPIWSTQWGIVCR